MVNGEKGIGEYPNYSSEIDNPEVARELLNQLFELSKNHAQFTSNGAFFEETCDGTGDFYRHKEPGLISFLEIKFTADRFRPEIHEGEELEDYRIFYSLEVEYLDEITKDQLDPRYQSIYEAHVLEHEFDPWLRQRIGIEYNFFMEGDEKVFKSNTSITTTIGFHMYEFGSDGVPHKIDEDEDVFEDNDEDESSDDSLTERPDDIQNIIDEFEMLTDDLRNDVMLNRHDISTALKYLNIVKSKNINSL